MSPMIDIEQICYRPGDNPETRGDGINPITSPGLQPRGATHG